MFDISATPVSDQFINLSFTLIGIAGLSKEIQKVTAFATNY